MTINQFRENYPKARIETSLRHYKPNETLKVNFFKTVQHPAECIMEAKIFQEGFVISSGSSYSNENIADDIFLECAEVDAIRNALDNLKESE